MCCPALLRILNRAVKGRSGISNNKHNPICRLHDPQSDWGYTYGPTSSSFKTLERCLQHTSTTTQIYHYMGCWRSYQVFPVLGENTTLTLKMLSQKLALLMALERANRISELQALDLRYRSYRPEGVTFRLPTLVKRRKMGAPPSYLLLELSHMVVSYALWNVYISMKQLHISTERMMPVSLNCFSCHTSNHTNQPPPTPS